MTDQNSNRGLSLCPHNSILGMFIPDYMIMYIDKIMTHGVV